MTAIALLGGCAARSRPGAPTLADADRLSAAGCHRCLVEALAIYEAALARKPTPSLTRRAFRTAILLAVREKEIGLSARRPLERAGELSSSLAADPRTRIFLTVAGGLSWDDSAQSPEAREEFVQTLQPRGGQLLEWRAALAPHLDADPVAAYLDAALVCQYEGVRDAVGRAALLARHPSSLALRFVVGASCRVPSLLEEVFAADSRYVEARFFIGRDLLAKAAGGRVPRSAALSHLAAAYEAFPDSPAVTSAMAGVYRMLNRLEEAVRYYDETIALVPGHRDAQLGRTMALSYLARHDAAVASATRILEMGQWYLGDAYYWRAYNELYLRDLDAAREDVERAKAALRLHAETFTLSGMIYFERKELTTAEVDLKEALRLNESECTADWYLGLVRAGQNAWSDASATFERAAGCYAQTAGQLRQELAGLLGVLADEREKAQITTEYQQLIARNVRDEGRSLYNAAYTSAQAGDRPRARAFAERAAPHPEMKSKADELMSALGR